MANDQIYKSRYTGEEMENAFSVVLAIANHAGIPRGTGNGSVRIVSMDTDSLTSGSERIPTSAVVAKAIAAARKVSEILAYKGAVQTVDDLPEDAAQGDVYIVKALNGENYAWDGTQWASIGTLVAPITLSWQSISYQVGSSGDTVPSGEWLDAIPQVPQGSYLWTRTVLQFSAGDLVTSYTCAYMGVDAQELTVCGKRPDAGGNVDLTADDVGAVEKSYVDTTDIPETLHASGWVGESAPYTQTVTVAGLTGGRRCMVYPAYGVNFDTNLAMREALACVSYVQRDGQNVTFTCLEDKPEVDIDVIVEVYV